MTGLQIVSTYTGSNYAGRETTSARLVCDDCEMVVVYSITPAESAPTLEEMIQFGHARTCALNSKR